MHFDRNLNNVLQSSISDQLADEAASGGLWVGEMGYPIRHANHKERSLDRGEFPLRLLYCVRLNFSEVIQ